MAVTENGLVTYVGRVVSVVKREERVMSDIYADVSYANVIEEDGSMKSLHLRSHFELCSSTRWAVADATPEWLAYAEAKARLGGAEQRLAVAEKAVERAAKPVAPAIPAVAKGDLVMVSGKAEGLTKGDILEVVWAGTSRYSDAARVGLLVGGQKVYCAATKVTRVGSTAELETAEREAAEATVAHREAAAVSLTRALESLDVAKVLYEAARPTATAVAA